MHEKHGFRVLIIYVFTLALSSVEGVKYMPETVERSQTHENPPWETDDRLPNSTYAEHYDLYLHPDLESKSFTGHVTIRISSSESRDYFLVHANLLTINKDTLNLTCVENQNAKTVVPIVKAFKYSPNEFFVIETDIVPPGTYELFLEFGGSLEGKIVGFYFSEYTTKSGEKRPLATSKFQPTFARQAFPCFDEPSFRSTFTITIVRPDNNYIGLSNMPVKNEVPNSPSPGLTEVHFEKSVSMVTYLACFIVSDFTYKEVNKTTMDGLMPFRVYASRDKIDDMQYALDFGSKVLLFFEDMFDYPFPLPKSDMAAIPDYSSGATEHWGIITYRETRIFYNENTSSSQDYESTSHVIAHELAHQWFGNLVTLEWWNDLWLNEGFASFIEYKGVDHEHPSWDAKSQFVTDRVQDVFDLDSQLSSHPIVKTVETPEEITAMFDSISYDKGASVLRMLEGFMGESDFQKGINQFLKDYAFKNAVTQDLWNELTAAWKDNVPKEYKTDIGEIMNSWTMQMGYPVVNVQRNSPTQLTVTQSRFLKDPNAVSDPSNSTFGYKWDIPISLVTSNEPNRQEYWLYRENEKLLIDIEEGVTWYKLNYRQVGYYRVNYSPDIWGQLQVLCADLSLTAEDRSSLYDDALALADAALLDYGIALNMTLSLVNENHYVPWKSASKRFEMMEYLLLGTNVLAPFKSYVRELVEPIYEVLHWQDAGIHLQRLLRYVIVDVASMSDVESSLDEAGKLLQSWIDDESYPSPLDTKRYAYWWGMIKSGSDANWNIMWERCLAELDPAQKNNLYYGLSNSQDPEILNKYIELTFDLDNTRMQDFLSILQYIALNPIGMDLSWDWIRSNWDALLNRYGPDDRYLGQLIPSVTQYFATSKKLAEMEVFYRVQANNGTAVLYRDQALETVKSNIFWVNTYSPVILAWLNLREKQ